MKTYQEINKLCNKATVINESLTALMCSAFLESTLSGMLGNSKNEHEQYYVMWDWFNDHYKTASVIIESALLLSEDLKAYFEELETETLKSEKRERGAIIWQE